MPGELAEVGSDRARYRNDLEGIILGVSLGAPVKPFGGVFHAVCCHYPAVYACGVSHSVRESIFFGFLLRGGCLVGVVHRHGTAVLFVENIAYIVGTLTHADSADFAWNIVWQLGHCEGEAVYACTFHGVCRGVEIGQSECAACADGVAQDACVPTVVGVLEVEIDFPVASRHCSRVVEVDFSSHVVVVAAPLGEPETLLGCGKFLIA